MSRFAGSQRLDERRRRRLATESDGSDETSLPADGDVPRPGMGMPAMGPEPARHGWGPLATLFSRYKSRYWLIGGSAVLVALGLLHGGLEAEEWSKSAGPAVIQLLAFPDAPLLTWFGQLMLLLSAETAVLIWWARSRSLRDFSGSYGIWAWAALAWIGLSLCLTTNAAEAWNATALFLWRAELTGIENLSWLFAVGLLANWLMIRLQQEMRGCPESRWSLVLAAVLYTGAAINEIAHAWEMTEASPLVRPALLIFAHITLFMSMTLHARHVLYETADPLPRPRRKRSQLRIPLPSIRIRVPRWLKELWAPVPSQKAKSARKFNNNPQETEQATEDATVPEKRGRKTRKAATSVRSAKEDVAEETVQEPVIETPTAPEPVPTAEIDLRAAEKPHVAQDEPEESDADDASQESEQSKSVKGRNFRVDAAHEQPSLKGLSKRERRKLQQQMRDAQRGNQ